MEKLSKYWKLLIFAFWAGPSFFAFKRRGEILTPFADFLLGKSSFLARAQRTILERRKFEFLCIPKNAKFASLQGLPSFVYKSTALSWVCPVRSEMRVGPRSYTRKCLGPVLS